ncbi:DUF3883 domain-containing protein [Nocardioides sp. GCM10028917]|uniref:DUF3883 domain-containing protein n=1 Tax=Nocardioides sp. GCM10028917 TaxID=3273408 RepID=UPI00360AA09C
MSVRRVEPKKLVGRKMANPTKLQLAQAIADALKIDRPLQSRGSSVDSTFLDRVHTALTGDTSTQTDAYRKAERVLQDVGLTYDPFWDTSESAGDTGGSTVTNRAYSRILAAVAHVPRCFLINVNDAEVGARWETDHEFRYAYDSTVSGRANFTDAGPGSRVIYYATSSHKKNPMHFIAHAEVFYIGPGWTGPWEATIANYTEFNRPVPVGEFEMEGWNRQISITEISYGTYLDLLTAGDSLETALSEDVLRDPGGEVVAQRVLEELPLSETAPALAVPPFLPLEDVVLRPAREPVYTESEARQTVTTGDLPTPRNAERNKLAETRAVELVTQALEAQGWTRVMDYQRFGVGYDLLFQKDNRRLHAEVKGIISGTLAFNLTPKEAWRVETDEDFAVIAVTNVLSPTAYELHFLTRKDLATAERIITGYRLKF